MAVRVPNSITLKAQTELYGKRYSSQSGEVRIDTYNASRRRINSGRGVIPTKIILTGRDAAPSVGISRKDARPLASSSAKKRTGAHLGRSPAEKEGCARRAPPQQTIDAVSVTRAPLAHVGQRRSGLLDIAPIWSRRREARASTGFCCKSPQRLPAIRSDDRGGLR
jgi:hypothetical protein